MSPVATSSTISSAGAPPVSQTITVPLDNDGSFPPHLDFSVAVTDAKGPRRFMEDAHSILVPFAGVRGQGFFAIFDGHAGKHAAEWCGQNFAKHLLQALRKGRSQSIPDVLNQAFHDVDLELSRLAEESNGKLHSGCTAVTAFLRLEDAEGKQSFLPSGFDPLAAGEELLDSSEQAVEVESGGEGPGEEKSPPPKRSSKTRLKDAIKSLAGESSTSSLVREKAKEKVYTPTSADGVRRVLYCANAGDARAVLCRRGRAVRLTYDHKGSDKQEAKRIMDAGGFVMSGRVNGVLAVTRSLGDSSMKEFVVGAPYTTETELGEDDEFLILACDGVWDVVQDQAAVDLVRGFADPKAAAQELMDHAFSNYSTDNITVIVVRLRDPPAELRSS